MRGPVLAGTPGRLPREGDLSDRDIDMYEEVKERQVRGEMGKRRMGKRRIGKRRTGKRRGKSEERKVKCRSNLKVPDCDPVAVP